MAKEMIKDVENIVNPTDFKANHRTRNENLVTAKWLEHSDLAMVVNRSLPLSIFNWHINILNNGQLSLTCLIYLYRIDFYPKINYSKSHQNLSSNSPNSYLYRIGGLIWSRRKHWILVRLKIQIKLSKSHLAENSSHPRPPSKIIF